MWIVDTKTLDYVEIDASDRYVFFDHEPIHYANSAKDARAFGSTWEQVVNAEREDAILGTDWSMGPEDKAALRELDDAVGEIVDTELFDVSAGHECLACGLTGVHRRDCAGMAMAEGVGVSTWF